MNGVLLQTVTGFDWDAHNMDKNRNKHHVQSSECEEFFFNQSLTIKDDVAHSRTEARFYALGLTDEGRKLLIVFTIRSLKIRIISARDMSRKEREIYEKSQI